jgi:competence protein ComGF
MDKQSNLQDTSETLLSPKSLEDIVVITTKVGLEYANAKKEADRGELLKSTRKAQAMEKYDDGKRSETKIRRLAEMDPEYIQFLNQLAEWKAKSEKLRIRYDSYKNLFEARRSMLSYQKMEMRIL